MLYFTDKETSCKCGCGKRISPELEELLDKIRAGYGSPIKVTSGARCPAHNKAVKGAPNSLHMQGKAVDLAKTPKLLQFIKDNLVVFNIRMEEEDNIPRIHIDLGYKGYGSRIFKP